MNIFQIINVLTQKVKKNKMNKFLTSMLMIPIAFVIFTLSFLLWETPEKIVARFLYFWRGDRF